MSRLPRMHEDELDLGEELVRGLLAEQFPDWCRLPLRRIEPSGTVNAIFRLGDDLAVRLPRRDGATAPGGREIEWLPKLAPLLPVDVPVPVAQGRPSGGYPWYWEVHSWVEGETLPVGAIDAERAARDLGALIAALQRSIRPAHPAAAACRSQSWTTTFARGFAGSAAIPGRQLSGSVRSGRRRGTGRRCGTTAISTPATGSSATAGSPA